MKATATATLVALLLSLAGGAYAAPPAPPAKGGAAVPAAPAAAPAQPSLSAAPAAPGKGAFNAAEYKVVTQPDILKKTKDYVGKKVAVTDPFQFCGSDFCVQIRTVKINTREYWCFTLGTVCVIRMYLKKDHPQAEEITKARKGDLITVYGTFEEAGSLEYIIVDRLSIEKKK